MKKTLLSTMLLLGTSSVAFAQNAAPDTLNGYFGAGVMAVPEYEGSDEMQAVPILAGRVNYNHYYVETKGLGLRGNISSMQSVEFGPALNYRFGRDDVDNNTIDRLSDIDDAIEAGGFVKIPVNGVLSLRDQLALDVSVLTDISDTHEGTLIQFGPSYSYAMTPKLRMSTSLSATYASQNYMDTYYSVDASNAAASGLSQFDADGGVKDIGVTLVGNYSVNKRWGVIGIAGYQELLGDAKDSPIIKNAGESGQFTAGLAVSYRF